MSYIIGTTVGKSIDVLATPGATSFVQVSSAGVASNRTLAQTLSDIGAQASGSYAASGANSDITSLTGLNAALATNMVKPISRVAWSANSDLTMTAGTNVVARTATLSTGRAINLPRAADLTAGDRILFIDESGTVDGGHVITLTREGTTTDTINGATTFLIQMAYGSVVLETDGISKFSIIGGSCIKNATFGTSVSFGLGIGAATLAAQSGGLVITDVLQVRSGTGAGQTMLKSNGTAWNCRLGNDSADAPFTASLGTFSGGAIMGAAMRLKSYTVATLPAGTLGDEACVTDALAPTFLATVVGSGAVVTPVFYNGSNWVGS